MPGRYFAPYDDNFTMMPFAYLSQGIPVLTSAYGVTQDRDRAMRINSAQSAAEVRMILAESDASGFGRERAEQFYGFVQKYVSNRQVSPDRLAWLTRWSPPPQFWGHADSNLNRIAGLKSVRVRMQAWWFDGSQHQLVAEKVLAELPVAARVGLASHGMP